jgi:Rrf2 family protein
MFALDPKAGLRVSKAFSHLADGILSLMISMKARYAVQALVYMASQSSEENAFVARKVAQAEDIPQKFLEEILLDLRKDGILQSKAGKSGGYRLKKRPSEISLQQVFHAISDPIAITSPSESHTPTTHVDDVSYLLAPIEKELKTARLRVLQAATIEQLVKRKAKRAKEEPVLDFQI